MATTGNGRSELLKWAAAIVIPLLISGWVAFSNLKSDVRSIETRVEVQYDAILRELSDIKKRLP